MGRETGKLFIKDRPDWKWTEITNSYRGGMGRILRVLLADGGLLASPDDREKDKGPQYYDFFREKRKVVVLMGRI